MCAAPYSDSNAAVRCTPTPGRLAPVLRLQRRRPLYSDSKASRAADCFIRASSPRPAARGRRARVDASASGVQLGEEIRRGDAGYFKDPLTAYGITDAFRDAELLARAMVAGTAEAFAGYQALREELSRPLFDITDEIASLEWTEDRLQSLHRAFSSEMSREVRALASLEPFTSSWSEVGAA